MSQLGIAYYLPCHPLYRTADKTNNGCFEEEYGTYNEVASTLMSASSLAVTDPQIQRRTKLQQETNIKD